MQQVKEEAIWEVLQAGKTSVLTGEDLNRSMPEYEETYPSKEITPMTTASKYRVLKNSRVATKTTFASYEQARQWVRSKLRRTVTKYQARRAVMWDSISRNPPSIGTFGYAIKRVA